MKVPMSQLIPVHPDVHEQLYLPGKLEHVPLFLHGFVKHSSTSIFNYIQDILSHKIVRL
jgi:hypothetical protein